MGIPQFETTKLDKCTVFVESNFAPFLLLSPFYLYVEYLCKSQCAKTDCFFRPENEILSCFSCKKQARIEDSELSLGASWNVRIPNENHGMNPEFLESAFSLFFNDLPFGVSLNGLRPQMSNLSYVYDNIYISIYVIYIWYIYMIWYIYIWYVYNIWYVYIYKYDIYIHDIYIYIHIIYMIYIWYMIHIYMQYTYIMYIYKIYISTYIYIYVHNIPWLTIWLICIVHLLYPSNYPHDWWQHRPPPPVAWEIALCSLIKCTYVYAYRCMYVCTYLYTCMYTYVYI